MRSSAGSRCRHGVLAVRLYRSRTIGGAGRHGTLVESFPLLEAQTNDIKGLSVLLASDASEWITGAIIPMDGGNLAMNAGGTPGHEGGIVQTFREEEE